MKINRLNASFGSLKNESLSFHKGLNVICLQEESERSSWCAFTETMLYGPAGPIRGQDPDLPPEGSMEVTANGCDLTLRRTTRLKNAPMGELNTVYTGSADPVKDITAQNAGERITGLNRDAFCRCAMIGQENGAVTDPTELEKRIRALADSGEEGVSFAETEKRLRSWQHKRRYENRGMIPALDAKANELRDALHEIDACAEESQALEAQLTEAEERCAALENAVAESRRLQRRSALKTLGSARSHAGLLEEKHEEDFTRLADARKALREGPFGELTLEEAEAKTQDSLERLRELAVRKAPRRFGLPAVLFLLLAAIGAACSRMMDPTVWSYLVAAAAAVACGASITLFLKMFRLGRENRTAEEESARILAGYHADAPEGITAQMEEHCSLWEAVNSAELAERRSRTAYEAAAASLTQTEETAVAALNFSTGDSEAAKYGRELAQARRETAELSRRAALLSAQLAAAGDPVVLRSSLAELEERREQLTAEYDAIALAEDTLREADSTLQSEYLPELSRTAAEYMRLMTDGHYSDLFLSRNFSAVSAAAQETEEDGTVVQLLYLAVRLAASELAQPQEESCPLILNDALASLSPEQFARAMELLREISKERQVILFTCREV